MPTHTHTITYTDKDYIYMYKCMYVCTERMYVCVYACIFFPTSTWASTRPSEAPKTVRTMRLGGRNACRSLGVWWSFPLSKHARDLTFIPSTQSAHRCATGYEIRYEWVVKPSQIAVSTIWIGQMLLDDLFSTSHISSASAFGVLFTPPISLARLTMPCCPHHCHLSLTLGGEFAKKLERNVGMMILWWVYLGQSLFQ